MKKNTSKAKWLLLCAMLTPTYSVGCAGALALEALDSVVDGMYLGAQAWGVSLANDFIDSLDAE